MNGLTYLFSFFSIASLMLLTACSGGSGGSGNSDHTYDTTHLHRSTKTKLGLMPEGTEIEGLPGEGSFDPFALFIMPQANDEVEMEISDSSDETLNLNDFELLEPEQYKKDIGGLFNKSIPEDAVTTGFRYLTRELVISEEVSDGQMIECVFIEENYNVVISNKEQNVVEISDGWSMNAVDSAGACTGLSLLRPKLTKRLQAPFSKEVISNDLNSLQNMNVYGLKTDNKLSSDNSATYIITDGPNYFVLSFNPDNTIHVDGVIRLDDGSEALVSMIPQEPLLIDTIREKYNGMAMEEWEEVTCPGDGSTYCAQTTGNNVIFQLEDYL